MRSDVRANTAWAPSTLSAKPARQTANRGRTSPRVSSGRSATAIPPAPRPSSATLIALNTSNGSIEYEKIRSWAISSANSATETRNSATSTGKGAVASAWSGMAIRETGATALFDVARAKEDCLFMALVALRISSEITGRPDLWSTLKGDTAKALTVMVRPRAADRVGGCREHQRWLAGLHS